MATGSRWNPLPERFRTRRSALVVSAMVALGAVSVAVLGPRTTPMPSVLSLWATKVDVPEPEVTEDRIVVPELPPSTLSMPVTYDLTPIIDVLERRVPRVYGSLEDRKDVPSNRRAKAAFELRRSPFQAELDGDVARVSSIVRYRGRAWYDPPLLPEVSASCGTGDGEDSPRAVIALSARLTLDDDWTLRGRARLDRVAPYSETDRDRCRITPLRIDVTDRVIDAANGLLTDNLPQVDAALARIDLRSRFEQWWTLLSDPIELAEDVWLVIDPQGVRRGPTRGEGQTLIASVGLSARPRIVLGERPQSLAQPLPPLDSASVEHGLHIQASGIAEYRAANRRLNEILGGRVLERDGRRLRIRKLRGYGIGGGKMAFEVTFDGTARGRVFLVGTPAYQADSGFVHVPDLDFDVSTSNALVSGVDWIAHQGLAQLLRERAQWTVDDITSLAEDQLRRGLNRRLSDQVHLSGTVDGVDILGVYPTQEHLVVHVSAQATGELLIGQEVESGPAGSGDDGDAGRTRTGLQ